MGGKPTQRWKTSSYTDGCHIGYRSLPFVYCLREQRTAVTVPKAVQEYVAIMSSRLLMLPADVVKGRQCKLNAIVDTESIYDHGA